jgi:NADPH:quinone reductase-like Zn-dependent oxidoreductase
MSNETMSAVIAEPNSGILRLSKVARPAAACGHVLVAVKAAAINPLDGKIRMGSAAHARQPLPAILGIDMSGVVEDVGEGVESFRKGDRVFGMTGGVGGLQGSLAEFASVNAQLLAKAPANLLMRDIAALPLIFITAWEGLVDRASVSAGEKVLIHGGAGGVGHVAIQIALSFGAEVFATGTGEGMAYIRSLGATPIDYRDSSVQDYVDEHTDGAGFDLVYDTVGGETLDKSFLAVRRFGHVVSCLGWGAHALAPLSFKAATYSGVFTLLPLLTPIGKRHHGEILGEAARLAEAGKLIPRVDPRRFDLSAVDRAFSAMESGPASGKLVVEVGHEDQ